MATSKQTILLVDDDYDFLFQHKFILEKAGYEVVSCDNQKEAEEIIRRMTPDLAIFDLMMESEDSGFVLSYKCKKIHPEVPVIISTSVSAETGISFGINSEDDRKWIKADLYLEKGISNEKFLSEVNKLLNG